MIVVALIPVGLLVFLWLRGGRSLLSFRELFFSFLFAASLGIIELVSGLFLRVIVAVNNGNGSSIAALRALVQAVPSEAQLLTLLPPHVFLMEFVRQAMTGIVLVIFVLIAVKGILPQCALALWVLSARSLVYYFLMWAILGWPSLGSKVVLYLIPVPWVSSAWVPLALGVLVIISLFARRRQKS